MNIIVFPEAQTATDFVAEKLVNTILKKPDAVLGLATGGTMPPVYAALLRAARNRQVSLSDLRSFNLDEYVGLAPDHPQSYHHFMRKHLFDHIDAKTNNLFVPRGDHPEPAQEASRYEGAIIEAGGIDVQLLGLGANGHIGFNEPSASFSSRTRVETLTDDTRLANARFFKADESVPSQAITVGIATILDARSILLLATGEAKARAVQAMIEGPIEENCPASALRNHPSVTVALDVGAASRLSSKTGCPVS